MSEATESGLPRVLAIAWGMYEAPQRGPKRELSHEGIVEAAIEIADTQGLPAVTMQRVAESLGFTTMSLYRYVASKDELLALMHDEACRAPDGYPIDDADWRQGLRDFAALTFRIYRSHLWMLDTPVSQTTILMPNNMRMADAGIRAMRTLPLTQGDKQSVLLAVSMFTKMFAELSRDIRVSDSEALVSPRAIATLREVATAERFPDLAPFVASGMFLGAPEAPDAVPGPPDPAVIDDEVISDDFEFGLARLLDGIGSYVADRPEPVLAPPTDPQAASDPTAALARAQGDLEAATALRKQAQQRLKQLERREAAAHKARDRAAEAAKRARS